MSTYKTQIFSNLSIPNTKDIKITLEDGLYRPENIIGKIDRITVVVNEDTGVIVAPVFEYLMQRYMEGLTNSSSESLGLRLYFEFLSAVNMEWDVGSDIPQQRPLHQFSLYLESAYKKGEISGSTASAYFDSVVRLYKHHLRFFYPFIGQPLEFKEAIIKKYDNDLLSHLYGRELNFLTATCKPRISSNERERELRPISLDFLSFFLEKLSNHASIELNLIVLTSFLTGLRASEIADLRHDMIRDWNGLSHHDIRVGPQSNHHTKKSINGKVTASRRLLHLLKKYSSSSHFLKRLEKCQESRTPIFLTRSGKMFSQKIISTEFRRFIREYINPLYPDFDHKFHDLRVSFGCYLVKSLLDSGNFSNSEILATAQTAMRHKHLATTEQYLRYWTRTVVQQEIDSYTEEKLSVAFDFLDSQVDRL